MPAAVGRSIKFFWGDTIPLPEIPGVREKGLELNGEPIDVTADDSNGWRELLAVPAENQANISLSGVTKDHRLKTDWFAGTRTRLATLRYSDGTEISGSFYLATYNETAVYNDAAAFEATLQSTGPVTLTPAP